MGNVRPRQFSLAYLFLEIFWIALALGISRFVYWSLFANSPTMDLLRVALMPVGLACYGAALGGIFGRMWIGALCGVATLVIFLAFFAPRVHS